MQMLHYKHYFVVKACLYSKGSICWNYSTFSADLHFICHLNSQFLNVYVLVILTANILVHEIHSLCWLVTEYLIQLCIAVFRRFYSAMHKTDTCKSHSLLNYNDILLHHEIITSTVYYYFSLCVNMISKQAWLDICLHEDLVVICRTDFLVIIASLLHIPLRVLSLKHSS